MAPTSPLRHRSQRGRVCPSPEAEALKAQLETRSCKLARAIRRKAEGEGPLSALCREAVAFGETLASLGYGSKRRPYERAALRLLLFLHSRGKSTEQIAASDFAAFREEVVSLGGPPSRARLVLKGARTFLTTLARDGRIREDQVPAGIAPRADEALDEDRRRELHAFHKELKRRHTATTAGVYAQGACDLLLFLEREAQGEVTREAFERFEEDVRGRALGGALARYRGALLLHGARAYLREKASRGEIADLTLLPLLAPGDVESLREAYLAHSPRAAAIFREACECERRLKSLGYTGAYRPGVLALLSFLDRTGRCLDALSCADWRAFRDEVKGDEHLVQTAGAYLRMKAKDGQLREDQVPAALMKTPGPGLDLPPALAGLSRTLDEAMEVSGFAATTRPSYRRALRGFLLWLASQGITSLAEVNRDTVTAYRLGLQTRESSRGAPLSVRTQIGSLVALRFFFGWLVKTGRALSDPTIHLPTPRPPQTLPRSLKPADIVSLLKSLPKTPLGRRDRAILELLYGTGLRRAEVARLALGDVDLEGRTLLVREGKGRKDRMVPLGRKAQAALLDYLDQARGKLLRGDDPKALFVGLGGRGISVPYFTQLVSRRGDRIGLKVRPHWLRHSCATHLLRGRADIRHIQRLLGHKSLQTTERYTKVEVADLRSVIDRCHPREKRTDI